MSAAILPMVPAQRSNLSNATTWQDLPIVSVSFPENLDFDWEGVYVIKTADQWRSFWARVPEVTVEGAETGEIPNVDFTHQFAVIASYGWKSEGYAIAVTHARFNGQQVAVSVDRQIPNPDNCRVYFDPFYGGIAVVEQPQVSNFESVSVGSTYFQVMEERWATATRNCGMNGGNM